MLEDFVAPYAAVREIDFAPLPLNAPPLHPLFVGYERAFQGDCTRAGGHIAGNTKEHQLHCDVRAWRPLLLFHHVRLDDVEHPGLSARFWCDACWMYDGSPLCARAASFLISLRLSE